MGGRHGDVPTKVPLREATGPAQGTIGFENLDIFLVALGHEALVAPAPPTNPPARGAGFRPAPVPQDGGSRIFVRESGWLCHQNGVN